MLLHLAFLGLVGVPRALSQSSAHANAESFVHDMLVAPWTQNPGPTVAHPVLSLPTGLLLPQSNSTCSYWLEDIKHQGIAPFNEDPQSYQVFRNVKDFGAKGDGVTDDTQAIQSAISSGNRCAPGSCNSTSTSPAVVYFPAGTYIISTNIIDYYYTQIIGNPRCMPTIRASANFTGAGIGLIDGDPYDSDGGLPWAAPNIFWRQIRNFVLDMTLLPANTSATGIHWPTSQATSLQNILFKMSDAPGTQHEGVMIESGSGGFVTDLVFQGGLVGMSLGNQQFTMRNLTFSNSVTAIEQTWNWGWLYKGITIDNCSIGLNMSAGGPTDQGVGSVTLIDSVIRNTPIGVLTAHDSSSEPSTGGGLILENIQLKNVPVAVHGPNGTALQGTTAFSIITAWGQGHSYTPNGPTSFQGPITPNIRPASLIRGAEYYQRSKPQYEYHSAKSFISARSFNATGDGKTDDTKALQAAILAAVAQKKVLFLDHGDYLVTSTIYIPANTKIVGETYSIILGSGSFFSDMNNPKPVLQVGHAGEVGSVEVSDIIVSTRGATAGAIVVEYNLYSSPLIPSGFWDFHVRIGGFAGSDLQVAQCPTTSTVSTPPAEVNFDCISAFLTMHVTKHSAGLYMENDWLWVADHDLEDNANLTQITIYAGRGLLIESEVGGIWLYGTGVEHHTKYQYQLVNTRDVFMGIIQTETAYYQPNPVAPAPYPHVASMHDPVFSSSNTTNASIPDSNGWGLRIVDSTDILVYGADFYSFFNNYNSSSCDTTRTCQSRIFSIEGTSELISVYNLVTVGTQNMITRDGVDLASYSDNRDGFSDTIALFRSGAA